MLEQTRENMFVWSYGSGSSTNKIGGIALSHQAKVLYNPI